MCNIGEELDLCLVYFFFFFMLKPFLPVEVFTFQAAAMVPDGQVRPVIRIREYSI